MAINLGPTAIADAKLGSAQVDKIYLGSTEVWSKSAPAQIKALKFTSSEVQTLGVNTTKLGTISPNFEYSTDNGATWTTWDVTTTLSFGNGTDLYVRGSNTFLAKAGDNYVNFTFSTQSSVDCSGNVMHLFDYTQDLTAFPDDAANSSRGVKNLFSNCWCLTSAPELPAIGLTMYCYYNMFLGCTRLTNPPALPATVLSINCYQNMFVRCTSLIALPALPATTLASSCYEYMFENCREIKMSTTQDSEYPNVFTFGTNPSGYGIGMFAGTGGSYASGVAQQTYYTSNTIIS